MKKGQRIQQVIGTLLIPLMLLLSWNAVSNWHYHIMPDGTTVEHSHPFSKSQDSQSPIKTHKHSQCEVCIFQQMAQSYLDNSCTLFEITLEEVLSFQQFIAKTVFITKTCVYSSSGLSPPLA